MRRLAAVFSGRKSSKSDVGSNDRQTPSASSQSIAGPTKGQTVKTRHSFFRTLTKGSSAGDKIPNKDISAKRQLPPLVPSRDACGASSTSSSGGPSTPLDDYNTASAPSPSAHGHGGHEKRSWLPFISEKSSAAQSKAHPESRPYIPHQFTVQADDDDTSGSSESEADERSTSTHQGTSEPLLQSQLPLTTVAYLRQLTEAALSASTQPSTPPPLLHVPGALFYPRSVNPPNRVPNENECLRANVLRTRLLARLTPDAERIDNGTGPGGELKAFHQRVRAKQRPKNDITPPAALLCSGKRIGSCFDGVVFVDANAVRLPAMVKSFSQGLKKWMNRPCFEDRMVVYLPNDLFGLDGQLEVRCERVYASAAVEALEVSERIQELAGADNEGVPTSKVSSESAMSLSMTLPDVFLSSSPIDLTPPLVFTPYSESPNSSGPSTPNPPPAGVAIASSTPSSSDLAITLTVPGAKPPPTGVLKAAPSSPLRMASTDSVAGNAASAVGSGATGPSSPSKSRSPTQLQSIIPPAIIPRSVSSSKVAETSGPNSPGTSSSTSMAPTTNTTSPMVSSPLAGSGKPVLAVRFAEEEKDDSIPLEYVMRIKQARNQKARFLAAERAKRGEEQRAAARAQATPSTGRLQDSSRTTTTITAAMAEERKRFEQERQLHEAERRKQGEERKKWEAERAQWEREKKEREIEEEERRKKAYGEEVIAARTRRESARFGAAPGRMMAGEDGVVRWEGDREREREKRGREEGGTYSRMRYDDSPARYGHSRTGSGGTASGSQRGESRDPPRPARSQTADSSNQGSGSSPGSSRPPSIAATGSVRGSSLYSTPPSSTSAVDVRQRKESGLVRSVPATPMYLPTPGSVPGAPGSGYSWAMGGNSSLPTNVVPVPVAVPVMPVGPGVNVMGMPMGMSMGMMSYGAEMQMPLLPPSAPFMMGGYSRHRGGSGSHGSRSHSSSPVRTGGSKSGSASGGSERSGRALTEVPSSSRGGGSGGGSSTKGHHRRASGDVSASYNHSGSASIGSNKSPYGNPQGSSSSIKSSRTNVVSQSTTSTQRPIPTSSTSWAQQPAFQNLSRPALQQQGGRRQTMIT